MPPWVCPRSRMSLLKPFAKIILLVGWCFVRIWIWSSITTMRCRSFTCEGMYRFMMRNSMSGLLVILKACRYGEILFGVGIFVMFSVIWMSLWIMVSTPPHGGPLWRICQWLP